MQSKGNSPMDFKLSVAFVLLQLHLALADRSRTPIVLPHKKVVVLEVSAAKLVVKCPITSLQPDFQIISWFRYGENLEKNRSYRYDGTRLVFVSSAAAREPLSGHYQCRVVNGFGRKTVNLTVIIYEKGRSDYRCGQISLKEYINNPTKPCFLYASSMVSNLKYESGETAQFTCSPGGSPQPHVRWYKNGHPIPTHLAPKLEENRNRSNNATEPPAYWTIPKLGPNRSGEYTCYVYNKHGNNNYTFSMLVNPPHITTPSRIGILAPHITTPSPIGYFIGGHPKNQTSVVGGRARFTCVLRPRSPVPLHWIKEIDTLRMDLGNRKKRLIRIPNLDNRIFYVFRKTVRLNRLKNGIMYDNYVIENVTLLHRGMYYCLLISDDGKQFTASAYLNVTIDQSANGQRKRRNNVVLYITTPLCVLLLCVSVILFCIVNQRCKQQRARGGTAATTPSGQQPLTHSLLHSNYMNGHAAAASPVVGRKAGGATTHFNDSSKMTPSDSYPMTPMLSDDTSGSRYPP